MFRDLRRNCASPMGGVARLGPRIAQNLDWKIRYLGEDLQLLRGAQLRGRDNRAAHQSQMYTVTLCTDRPHHNGLL